MATEELREAPILALLARGEDEGCLRLSEIEELTEELTLGDEALEGLYREIDEREIEIRDDCGRVAPLLTRYENGELATVTVDALQLFLNEIGRYPLLTAREEIRACQADRTRRRRGQGTG